jgi:hypothetical protein
MPLTGDFVALFLCLPVALFLTGMMSVFQIKTKKVPPFLKAIRPWMAEAAAAATDTAAGSAGSPTQEFCGGPPSTDGDD